jgi:hypothetical protein
MIDSIKCLWEISYDYLQQQKFTMMISKYDRRKKKFVPKTSLKIKTPKHKLLLLDYIDRSSEKTIDEVVKQITNKDKSEEIKNFFSPKDDYECRYYEYRVFFVAHVNTQSTFRYNYQNQTLTLDTRRLVQLSDTYKNENWKNPDDFKNFDKESFFDEVNKTIGEYVIDKSLLDIRYGHITRIDYCFNIFVKDPKEYIIFFNNIYKNETYPSLTKHMKNFCNVKGICQGFNSPKENHSFYLRTKSDYDNRQNHQYTINFYDKSDRYDVKKREIDWSFKDYENWEEEEKDEKDREYYKQLAEETKGILRVELQLFYKQMRYLLTYNKKSEETNFKKQFPELVKTYKREKKRYVKDWFSIDVAQFLVKKFYTEQISPYDYYSFQNAKKEVKQHGNFNIVSDFCKKLNTENKYRELSFDDKGYKFSKINWSSNKKFKFPPFTEAWETKEQEQTPHKINLSAKDKKAIKELERLNIFPYGFLIGDDEYLINPLKLIDEKIKKWKKENKYLKKP